MITVLQYLVIAAAIGLVVFFVTVLVFGRGEQLAPLPVRTSPAELPEKGVAGGDVRAVRFAVAVRGYRMSDVDWTLDRLADETDRLRAEVRRLGGDPDAVVDAPLLPESRPEESPLEQPLLDGPPLEESPLQQPPLQRPPLERPPLDERVGAPDEPFPRPASDYRP